MILVEIVDSAGFKIAASYDHDGQDGRDILTALSGWSGGVGVRSENVDRLGHGTYPTANFRSGRTITVDLMLERDTRDELWGLERGLSGLFSDGGYGTITVHQDESILSAQVRLDGEVKPTVHLDGGYVEVQIPLQAPLPYLYSPWRESYLRPIGAGVGLEYAPFSKGGVITFGTAVASDEWVWNDGNADSTPVFEVTAESQGFAVGLGNKRVTYPWPTFPDVPVTVDMAGALTVGGVDQSHLLGERTWSSVPPHSMERPFFEFLRGGEGWAVVRHRDTLI